jgi:penicillin-binding protein 1C
VTYKFREAWLALKYDARWSKHDILERYLNTTYFGHGAYGISAAARRFFDADVESLSLSQSALLVGLLNAPSALNPFVDRKGAAERRDLVLHAMQSQKMISEDELKEALSEPIELSSGRDDIKAPHFVQWLLSLRPDVKKLPIVKTTIDLDLQTQAEAIVERQIEKLKDKNVTSASIVVLDASNGDILAMVGSHDYFDSENDGAVNVAVSPRQPGSAVKPFTYALALSSGMTPATLIMDIEAQFFTAEGNPYVPRNYDYGYHGPVRLREALANSYNIAAVKVAEFVGVPRLLSFLQSTGLTTLTQSPEHYGLALTLGDSEVKLLELTSAYGVFASGGDTLPWRALLDDPLPPRSRILDPKIAWLVTDILSDADARTAEFGVDGPLNFPYPVAAKTGTTRNSRDNWTVGYSPQRIVGVWVGNANNSPMRGTSGITGAGPIFHDVMNAATSRLSTENFKRPEGILDQEICRVSGKLPTQFCTSTLVEHFIAGTQPLDDDDMMISIAIDARNGLRAGDSCPEQYVRNMLFTSFPLEARKWAREHGWSVPPDDYSPLCPGTSLEGGTIVITRPSPQASYVMDPLVPDEQEMIVFEARAPNGTRTLPWYVNGLKVGEGKAPDYRFKWLPRPGDFTIETGSGSLRNAVHIEIKR